MTQKKNGRIEQFYTYTEFKENFFPNLITEQDDTQLSNETLLDVLGKISDQKKAIPRKETCVKET